MAVSQRTPGERLAGKYTEQSNGCHEWGRARNSRGYGVIWFDGKLQLAHRLAFLARHERWPRPDMVVDHTCNNKACVNADHLNEVENWKNIRRASPTGDAETEKRRERWRRADSRRRGTYSPTWAPERV